MDLKRNNVSVNGDDRSTITSGTDMQDVKFRWCVAVRVVNNMGIIPIFIEFNFKTGLKVAVMRSHGSKCRAEFANFMAKCMAIVDACLILMQWPITVGTLFSKLYLNCLGGKHWCSNCTSCK